jgi:hypothetical protein
LGELSPIWRLSILDSFFNYKLAKSFNNSISADKSEVLILTKSGLGHILSDFFASSFGRPACKSFRPSCLGLLASSGRSFLGTALLISGAGLPDGIFSNLKSEFG